MPTTPNLSAMTPEQLQEWTTNELGPHGTSDYRERMARLAEPDRPKEISVKAEPGTILLSEYDRRVREGRTPDNAKLAQDIAAGRVRILDDPEPSSTLEPEKPAVPLSQEAKLDVLLAALAPQVREITVAEYDAAMRIPGRSQVVAREILDGKLRVV